MEPLEVASELSDFLLHCIEEGLIEHEQYLDAFRLVHAAVNDRVVSFYEDDPLIEMLWEQFNEEHPVWNHVELEL